MCLTYIEHGMRVNWGRRVSFSRVGQNQLRARAGAGNVAKQPGSFWKVDG